MLQCTTYEKPRLTMTLKTSCQSNVIRETIGSAGKNWISVFCLNQCHLLGSSEAYAMITKLPRSCICYWNMVVLWCCVTSFCNTIYLMVMLLLSCSLQWYHSMTRYQIKLDKHNMKTLKSPCESWCGLFPGMLPALSFTVHTCRAWNRGRVLHAASNLCALGETEGSVGLGLFSWWGWVHFKPRSDKNKCPFTRILQQNSESHS